MTTTAPGPPELEDVLPQLGNVSTENKQNTASRTARSLISSGCFVRRSMRVNTHRTECAKAEQTRQVRLERAIIDAINELMAPERRKRRQIGFRVPARTLKATAKSRLA